MAFVLSSKRRFIRQMIERGEAVAACEFASKQLDFDSWMDAYELEISRSSRQSDAYWAKGRKS